MRASLEAIHTGPDASFACFQRVDDSFEFEWHFHPEFELTLITSGRGRRFVGDHIEDYHSGDLVLLGSNIPHTWQSSSNNRSTAHEAVVVQFRHDFLGGAFFEQPETRRVARLLVRASRGLHFAGPTARSATKILAELPNRQGLERLLCLLKALDLLAGAKGVRTLAGASYSSSLALADGHRIDRILKYLSEYLDQTVTQREAAKRVHMSPSSFGRFFKRVTGRTFVDYLNELRISEACRLLCETDLRISEIAPKVGFPSLSYFNRRFQRIKGMSARRFRQTFTESANEASR